MWIFTPFQQLSSFLLLLNLLCEPMSRGIIMRMLWKKNHNNLKRTSTVMFNKEMEMLEKEGMSGNLQSLF